MGFLSERNLFLIGSVPQATCWQAPRQSRKAALRLMRHAAMRAADGSPEASGCRPRRWFPRTARPPSASATAAPPPRQAESRTMGRSEAAPVPRASRDIARNRRPASAISRSTSRLRLRCRAASSSPIRPSRVSTPSRPSGCVGGVSPSEICSKAPGRSTPLSHAFIGSTRRGLASMKCGVPVASSRM